MKDDIFFVWKLDKNTSLEEFKEYLNSLEPRIQFTSEIEENRILNFADLSIKRLDDRFIMKVYRKESHTNKYINWRSNVPRSYITGAMKSLIHRAYDLCTLQEDRKDELEFLKDTFIANDCPVTVVDEVFKNYIPRKYNPMMENKEKGEQDDFGNIINLPFIKGFSERIRRELSKEGINVVFKKGRTLEKTLCKFRPKIPKELSKDNIYLKKCNKCSSKYIGESGQTLKQRDIGHKSDINTKKTRSGLFKHIQENPGHEIDWENQIILEREPNMFKRRIKEAMFIRANDDGSLMNLDKGTMINNCWTEFNGMIRKFMQKR